MDSFISVLPELVFYGAAGYLIGQGMAYLRIEWRERQERLLELTRREAHLRATDVVFDAMASELKFREASIPSRINAAVKNKNGMFRKADAEAVCRDLLRGIVSQARLREGL